MYNNLSCEYVARLESLTTGQLSLLRTLRYQPLDASLTGFDIFTAIWWPLREKGKHAPRREIAWLVLKLYATNVLRHEKGATLPLLLGNLHTAYAHEEAMQNIIFKQVQSLLSSTTHTIEPILDTCISLVKKEYTALDWIHLLDTISAWEAQSAKMRWAEDFYNNAKIPIK